VENLVFGTWDFGFNIMTNNIGKAARFLLTSKYVTCLTGAGISVESGVRPFRGPGGLWAELGEPPMDGYQRFLADPKTHWEKTMKGTSSDWKFLQAADEAVPNPAHYALAELEEMGILQYLITQNIDNLHLTAGNTKVAEIHGNIKKVRCIKCNARYGRDDISLDVMPPHCPKCGGIIKTDIVMFGEPIPRDVLKTCQREMDKSDCMLAVGTSSLVYPAASFPMEIKRNGGNLIEVNLYETEMTPYCDISLRGKAGEVLPELVNCIKQLQTKS
jgi:NAD-dependent deacetylase